MAAGCWQTPRPMTQPGGPTLPRRLGVGRLDSVPSMACSCPDWVWVPREGRDWGQELARLPEAMHVGSLVTVPHKRPALHGTERPRCWPSPGPRREQLPSPQPYLVPPASWEDRAMRMWGVPPCQASTGMCLLLAAENRDPTTDPEGPLQSDLPPLPPAGTVRATPGPRAASPEAQDSNSCSYTGHCALGQDSP